MKKFSNITGQKVTEEPKPKVSKEQQELLEFKSNVLYLMDNFLTVRSNGSARQELLQNSISISGKEMFVEALLDLITQKNVNEGIKILESLKKTNTDWLTIDNKINELYESINDQDILLQNRSHVKRIVDLLETYGNDDRFEILLESNVKKIKNSKDAYLRSLIASKLINQKNYSNLPKDKLMMISERYLTRAKNLGNL